MANLSEIEGWMDIRWEYIPDIDDKILECRYFLNIASKETDVNKFRWQISAFLNSAYSYFEIGALNICHAFTDSDGNTSEDSEAKSIFSKYVKVTQDKKNPYFVKTAGIHNITSELYKIRKKNTHYSSIMIVPNIPNEPESFEFRQWNEPSRPALKFCREVMLLINNVQKELNL